MNGDILEDIEEMSLTSPQIEHNALLAKLKEEENNNTVKEQQQQQKSEEKEIHNKKKTMTLFEVSRSPIGDTMKGVVECWSKSILKLYPLFNVLCSNLNY